MNSIRSAEATRPSTAYYLWRNECRQRKEAGLPVNTNSKGEVCWNTMTAEEKQPYLDLADKQMLDYLTKKFDDGELLPNEYNIFFNVLLAFAIYIVIVGSLYFAGYLRWLQG